MSSRARFCLGMCFDFIPISSYTALFNWTILFLILGAVYQAGTGGIFSASTARLDSLAGFLFVVALIMYMGARPVSAEFGDTINYAAEFQTLQQGEAGNWKAQLTGMKGEWLFAVILHAWVQHGNVHDYFLTCSAVYVGALALASYRIFGARWFIPFLITCAMFTFWVYGVNGVRNGMAASVMILGLTFRSNLKMLLLCTVLAVSLHKSMMLLAAAGVCAWFITDTRYYVAAWVGSILAVILAGPAIGEMIASSGFFDDPRLTLYINQADELKASSALFSSVGFRWDFLIYSALPIVTGCYFLFREEYRDVMYTWLLNIYIAANAFWILCMYAAFSNRFAQLSWFLMGFVFIYPFFKQRFWADQEKKLACFIPVVYAFTFYMNIYNA